MRSLTCLKFRIVSSPPIDSIGLEDLWVYTSGLLKQSAATAARLTGSANVPTRTTVGRIGVGIGFATVRVCSVAIGKWSKTPSDPTCSVRACPQALATAQTRPHSPQFSESVNKFVHKPSQQTSPMAQIFPHSPQFLGSAFRFRHRQVAQVPGSSGSLQFEPHGVRGHGVAVLLCRAPHGARRLKHR